jgi:NAD(P)-dependent dehydrogenase (short-subunit alcohol dehydrogenase family)
MGLSISRLLASRGAILSLADMNEDGLVKAIESLESQEVNANSTPAGVGNQETLKSKSLRHIWTRVDVRDSASVNNWILRTVERLGRLDGAVNFAGVAKMANVIDETDDSWDFQMNVNARGVFFCIRAQLRHMEKGGSIVSHESHQNIEYYSLLATNTSRGFFYLLFFCRIRLIEGETNIGLCCKCKRPAGMGRIGLLLRQQARRYRGQ